MNHLKKHFIRVAVSIRRNDSGQDLIEYALVATVVALGAAASMRYIQIAILNAVYNSINIVIASF